MPCRIWSRALAADWFARFEGAGLDGVVAKRLEESYQPGKRAMVKVTGRLMGRPTTRNP